ncbi:MAG: hypothetical protein LE168_03930 [Endomicrobium sp.]|nr:hypothetical protein [Endomicrobium sp.]
MWKTKSARGVSMLMFLICDMGSALWIAYGLGLNKPATNQRISKKTIFLFLRHLAPYTSFLINKTYRALNDEEIKKWFF